MRGMVTVLLNFGLAVSTFVSPTNPQQKCLEAGVPGLTRPNMGRQPTGTPLEGTRSHGRRADEFHNCPVQGRTGLNGRQVAAMTRHREPSPPQYARCGGESRHGTTAARWRGAAVTGGLRWTLGKGPPRPPVAVGCGDWCSYRPWIGDGGSDKGVECSFFPGFWGR